MKISAQHVSGLPHPKAVRNDMERHLGWIAEAVKAKQDDLVLLEVKVELSHSFFSVLMRDEPSQMDMRLYRAGLKQEVIRDLKIEPSTVPSIRLDWSPGNCYSKRATDQGAWRATWKDCPVVVRLPGLIHPVVILRTPYSTMDNYQGWHETVVLAKQDVFTFMKIIEDVSKAERESVVKFYGCGTVPRRNGSWDEVLMGPEAETLLRRDFEGFWDRREWFQRLQLPYRRGYLLHGPPGNGKTSAIRAMLSHKGISAHSIHLHMPNVDDGDMLHMFEAAGSEAPSLVVLEDIDRCFAPRAEMDDGPQVHLQTLLNCLDGVATCDGVVVVATANAPEVLDAAILRRPGRFDRVIEFPNPSADLRQKYLAGKLCTLSMAEMQACVDKTAGFSFAQLQESYILAGQFAYDDDRDVTGNDLLQAAEMLKGSMHRADRKRTESRGFRPSEVYF